MELQHSSSEQSYRSAEDYWTLINATINGAVNKSSSDVLQVSMNAKDFMPVKEVDDFFYLFHGDAHIKKLENVGIFWGLGKQRREVKVHIEVAKWRLKEEIPIEWIRPLWGEAAAKKQRSNKQQPVVLPNEESQQFELIDVCTANYTGAILLNYAIRANKYILLEKDANSSLLAKNDAPLGVVLKIAPQLDAALANVTSQSAAAQKLNRLSVEEKRKLAIALTQMKRWRNKKRIEEVQERAAAPHPQQEKAEEIINLLIEAETTEVAAAMTRIPTAKLPIATVAERLQEKAILPIEYCLCYVFSALSAAINNISTI